MPLFITPSTPLKTTSLLDVTSLYAIVDTLVYNRKRKLLAFTLGYYATEAASANESGAAQIEANLPTGFSLALTPAQAARAGDPVEVMEEYVRHELLALLPEGSKVETVV